MYEHRHLISWVAQLALYWSTSAGFLSGELCLLCYMNDFSETQVGIFTSLCLWLASVSGRTVSFFLSKEQIGMNRCPRKQSSNYCSLCTREAQCITAPLTPSYGWMFPRSPGGGVGSPKVCLIDALDTQNYCMMLLRRWLRWPKINPDWQSWNGGKLVLLVQLCLDLPS